MAIRWKILRSASCSSNTGPTEEVEDCKISLGTTEHLCLDEHRPDWSKRGCRPIGVWDDRNVRILMTENAFLPIHRHAASNHHEICGILVGHAYVSEGIIHVEVLGAIATDSARAGASHVTFTADTWAELLNKKEREAPDQTIVGWYHSHPGMGIFLSGQDLFIHNNFFQSPWHVALVVDAHNRMGGLFAWDGNQVRLTRGFCWMETITRRRSPLRCYPLMLQRRNKTRRFSHSMVAQKHRDRKFYLYKRRSRFCASAEHIVLRHSYYGFVYTVEGKSIQACTSSQPIMASPLDHLLAAFNSLLRPWT